MAEQGSWVEDAFGYISNNSDLIVETVDRFITTPEESMEQERQLEQLRTKQKKYQAQVQQAQAQAQSTQSLVIGLGGLGIAGLLIYLFLG